MRSVVLTIRPRPFIEASRAIGLTPWKIVLRHVIPNALPPVIVVATVSAATAILAEAGLSFLGLGVQPPTPTWGNVIAEGPDLHHHQPAHLPLRGALHRLHGRGAEPAGRRAARHLDPQMRRNTGKLL
jgi:peptide/nickel transport system permease protein